MRFHSGRVLLAGDAAHIMPPFMGEGMCTGVRDVINLSWKLDFVLTGLVSEAILDTYAPERLPFVHTSVHASIAMGQVSCELNPEAAAGRDAAMRSGAMPPPPAPPVMVSELQTWFASFGGRAITIDPTVEKHAVDLDERLTGWLDGAGVGVVLYRPDQFVFGSGSDPPPRAIW
jgi:hypothetical protein